MKFVLWQKVPPLQRQSGLSMSQSRGELGQSGEKAALDYFHSKGYRLVKSNFRTRHGEADLILMDGDVLVFCEVKTKRSLLSGHAAESYTPKQQKRLRGLVLRYLRQTAWEGALRIDVLALQREPEGPYYRIHHFENALNLEDNW